MYFVFDHLVEQCAAVDYLNRLPWTGLICCCGLFQWAADCRELACWENRSFERENRNRVMKQNVAAAVEYNNIMIGGCQIT